MDAFRRVTDTRIRATLAMAICLTLPGIPAFAGTARASEPNFAVIDAYVEAQMKEIRIPGLALGIIQGDQTVHLKGYGVADPSGRRVTPQTPFTLASLAKSFTALAIMQLVKAGHVELDAPVHRYIPWFRLADEKASASITVRHLLNQTSGISAATGNEKYPSRAMMNWTPEQRVRELRDNPLTYRVGTTYEYSNVNYSILALIVQTVSGQSFEAYVQEHIFAPLDMRHSTMYQAEALPPDIAVGYQQWFGFPVASDVPLLRSGNGSGGLIASAEDMSHYLIAQLNNGRYGDAAVLSPEGIAELHRPAARDGDSGKFYGMGWEVETVNSLTTISHNGDHANFHANMVLTGDGWGIVLMTNANSLLAATRITGIAMGVASLLRGQSPPANEGVLALRMMYFGTLGIVALQILGMIWSLVVLRRWSQRAPPEPRPYRWLAVGWHVVVPLVANLALAYVFMVGLPGFFGISLQGMVILYPDFGYALLMSGVVALVWIIRTVLAYFALRGAAALHRPPAPLGAARRMTRP
jgi:CubicO group peptidase (beta-lactamase class C family)